MQPQSPNPNYDFIFNGGQKPAGKFSLPSLGLPKPVKLGVLVIVGIMVLVILGSLFNGSKVGSTQSVISLMARAQEISRISLMTYQGTQDPSLQTLATTVSTTMDSQEAQFKPYAVTAGKQLDPKLLSADMNSSTDTTIQTAIQNNNLSSAYSGYLSGALNTYKAQLGDEYKKASNPQLKSALNDAFNSVQIILSNASQLKS